MEPKRRYPRVERHGGIELAEDENAHLWAISYSDFLMALLSFFILFFSMDDGDKSSLIVNLAKTFNQSAVGPGGNAGQASSSRFIPKQLLDQLRDVEVSAQVEQDALLIHFPDQFFSSRQFQLGVNQNKILAGVLSRLKPYNGEINLYFVGHADNRLLNDRIENLVFDNILLSSLRAASALHRAKESGFDEKTLFIQAASSNTRNSRSLSLRIESRRGAK